MDDKNYARAKPYIYFEEQYNYSSEIRENRFTDYEKGEGKIEIKYKMGDQDGFGQHAYYDLFSQPYQPPGKTSYGKGSLLDFVREKFNKGAPNKINYNQPILTGRLAVMNNDRTDIQRKLDLSYNLHELYLPYDELRKDIKNMVKFKRELSYHPEEPRGSLISVRGQFTDEKGFIDAKKIKNKGPKERTYRNRSSNYKNDNSYYNENSYLNSRSNNEDKKFEELYKKSSVFEDEALIKFTLNISLPKSSIPPNNKRISNPILSYFYIDWPISFGGVSPMKNNDNFNYDPEKERLEWKGVQFEDLSSSRKNKRTKDYETEIGFYVPNPVTLFDVPHLDAYMMATLNGILLSETYPRFFNATGFEDKPPRIKTKLYDDISVDLKGIFRQKKYIPYRHLVFSGVTPEEKRFEDVKHTLRDMGVKVNEKYSELSNWSRERGGNKEDGKYYHGRGRGERDGYILGETKIGASKADIFIEMKGEEKEMERSVQLQGGYTGKTRVETGETKIILLGKHPDYKALSGLFNDISSSLKEKFTQVTMIG